MFYKSSRAEKPVMVKINRTRPKWIIIIEPPASLRRQIRTTGTPNRMQHLPKLRYVDAIKNISTIIM